MTTYAPDPLCHYPLASSVRLWCAKCRAYCSMAEPCPCDSPQAAVPPETRSVADVAREAETLAQELEADVRLISDSDAGTAEEKSG